MSLSPDGVALGLAAVASLLTLALLRADRPLMLAVTTVVRLFVTGQVFTRMLVEGLRRRWKGEKNLGPELLRRAFEDLGPTYLKLAQIIASSSGLFPEAYCKEFSKTL